MKEYLTKRITDLKEEHAKVYSQQLEAENAGNSLIKQGHAGVAASILNAIRELEYALVEYDKAFSLPSEDAGGTIGKIYIFSNGTATIGIVSQDGTVTEITTPGEALAGMDINERYLSILGRGLRYINCLPKKDLGVKPEDTITQ